MEEFLLTDSESLYAKVKYQEKQLKLKRRSVRLSFSSTCENIMLSENPVRVLRLLLFFVSVGLLLKELLCLPSTGRILRSCSPLFYLAIPATCSVWDCFKKKIHEGNFFYYSQSVWWSFCFFFFFFGNLMSEPPYA